MKRRDFYGWYMDNVLNEDLFIVKANLYERQTINPTVDLVDVSRMKVFFQCKCLWSLVPCI